MIKALIHAFYLSQSLIQGVPNHDRVITLDARPVHTFHIRTIDLGDKVVTVDGWYSEKTPTPYAGYWNCPYRQTAQQCIAVMDMLQRELSGVDHSPIAEELRRLKDRIEENHRRRQAPFP